MFLCSHRKSFEFEDVVQFTGQGTVTDELQPSDMYHALSNDNVYEDIIRECLPSVLRVGSRSSIGSFFTR